ncbi:MAG: two-component sensor histidine kinase [Synechococcales cyanobacterium M58_A2018_015]|nr:two-component sensor histidine kinase [Synechococcales cyanobacterium M58_A2018_015]
MQNRPFHLSRRRLAAWYTGIMALILMLCGLVIHRLVVHARWLNLVQEVQRLANRIEIQIQPALEQAGMFEPTIHELLPELCLTQTRCSLPSAAMEPESSAEALVTALEEKGDYCIRFQDPSGQTVAFLRLPPNNPDCLEPTFWKTLRNSAGDYYHQLAFPLHTRSNDSWGTMRIAHSLNRLDLYLLQAELIVGGLMLLGVVLIGFASWWLAGLAMRPMQVSYRQMQQFTADAAHELRTPLAASQAIVQTALRSTDLTLEDAQEALRILNRQNRRLIGLVQDLLILSQAEQQTRSNAWTPCCLNAMMIDLFDEFEALAIAANIQLITKLENQTDVYVLGHAEQLYRAVANLLSNAIQYTPAPGWVTLQLTTDHNHAVIHVEDTGIGIAPEVQHQIFDRFYRVDPGRSRHSGGSGLGLAITQAIVHTHRGSLQVRSELGKGSIFTITLPLCPPSKRVAS